MFGDPSAAALFLGSRIGGRTRPLSTGRADSSASRRLGGETGALVPAQAGPGRIVERGRGLVLSGGRRFSHRSGAYPRRTGTEREGAPTRSGVAPARGSGRGREPAATLHRSPRA